MKRDKILIVEDDIDLANLIDFNLTTKGYKSECALNGIAAMGNVASFHPDLIILDLMLPGIDGWKVCRWLKENEQLRNIPILMLTAKAMPEDRVKGFETGADDYMTKPFDVRELMIRVERLLEKRRERSAFCDCLRIIGHEVGNKMSAISGLSSRLSEDGLVDDENKKRLLKTIGNTASLTAELISEFRTLIDAETGNLVLNPAEVNICDIITDIVKSHEEALLHRGPVLNITADNNIPPLQMDRVAAKQVFTNIIGNAVKYSGADGEINVSIGSDERGVIVTVKDKGCGIPKDDIPSIFERGYRAKNAVNMFNGSGIGLYIVKLLLDKMGAGIDVKSEDGRGSAFTVIFPVL